MSRNYRKEYDNYHSRPEQKIRRAARNAARARFKDADPNKDVHHKDNNPLNNDRNNLSLVTQHYNRREPRLRKEALTTEWTISDVEIDEAPIVVSNEVSAIQVIVDKFEALLQKSDFKKKQKLAQSVGIRVSLRGKHRVKVEDVEESMSHNKLNKLQKDTAQAIQKVGKQDASGLQQKTLYKSSDEMSKSTRAFQLHFDKVTDTETQGLIVKGLKQVLGKKEIFSFWDAKFAKRLASFSEDMGTVTGPHIAGTGDDSSTVVVKKKKKKKDVHVRFKLKNQKSLKKRILDNVLAIQQKV